MSAEHEHHAEAGHEQHPDEVSQEEATATEAAHDDAPAAEEPAAEETATEGAEEHTAPPQPVATERKESWWQEFLRYYVFIPAPAEAMAQDQTRKQQQGLQLPPVENRQIGHGEHQHAPYMAVFGWLVVLTMIEVAPIFTEILFGFTPVPHNIWIPILLILAIAKATLVAMYYMHLRYDQPWLVALLMVPLGFAMLFGLAIVAS